MSLVAPTVDQRVCIPDDVIQELISKIASQFRPEKIILFGSYAYGNPRPESDVDLLVVMNTALREIQQSLQIRQYLNPLFGVDILVYTPARLEERLKLGDPFIKEIIENGAVIYESPDA
jgi:predicted nucleotidyltransferase